MAELGDRIKEARGSLTQKEFAAKIGVDNTTVASWEIGRREPDLDSLIKIAEMSGVSLDWLAGRYDCDIEIARSRNDCIWHDIIDITANNNIQPELLRTVIAAIVAIKKA
ncbi:MAG: helix-turn-helix transcriptional regulator [Negativicutes bacterium]|nr:helix-turn-helix transcriptional regulator [Negativicutes bacterium]